jgi:Kef-type K+ transport system membrane component KefB
LSIIVAVTAILISFVKNDRAVTNGLWVGSAAGISFFMSAWWCATVIIKNKKEEKANRLKVIVALNVFVLKFPVLGIALWYAFKYLPINALALVGGVAVTQIAILLSVLIKFLKK